ncbi:MAG: hypothetical protein REI94_03725 [Moraxellaceae bacterium]|nr:hypothetical protein [Moraxellaceae bacterium]
MRRALSLACGRPGAAECLGEQDESSHRSPDEGVSPESGVAIAEHLAP